MYQEAKPKKLRKKVKPSAMIRPQKRSKKKKRPNVKTAEGVGCVVETTISAGKQKGAFCIIQHELKCCLMFLVSIKKNL